MTTSNGNSENKQIYLLVFEFKKEVETEGELNVADIETEYTLANFCMVQQS